MYTGNARIDQIIYKKYTRSIFSATVCEQWHINLMNTSEYTNNCMNRQTV